VAEPAGVRVDEFARTGVLAVRIAHWPRHPGTRPKRC
jgi:hypothetical protein